MILSKKARQSALFDIANSEVVSGLVYSFLKDSNSEENNWLKNPTYNKRDKGARELILGEDFAMIRPVFKNSPAPNGIMYGFENSGYSRISAHRNSNGWVDISKKDMIKLFAEELAAQLIMGEFDLAYGPCSTSKDENIHFGTYVVIIKYNVKKSKNHKSPFAHLFDAFRKFI